MRRLVGSRGATGDPLLSVIVPAFDIEDYLDDCLASVSNSTFSDCEVIVVDDGSTDATAATAQGWASRDRRFQVIHQENHGLGHARNTGLRASRGRYLAFLDGDDLVPPDAYAAMVGSLGSTGSEIAAGAVLRMRRNGKLRRTSMHRGIYTETRLATNAERHPALMRDIVVTNKLWRRDAWFAKGRWFPEGVFYEDIAIAVLGVAEASSIDVLSTPVYIWRQRDPGSPSITQDRTNIRHVRDRLTTVTFVSRALQGRDRLKKEYDANVFGKDLMIFLKVLPRVDDAYRREAALLTRRFIETAHPEARSSLDAADDMKLGLLLDEDFGALVALLEAGD
jgi:CDP-glycerol glycerophosphotransferase